MKYGLGRQHFCSASIHWIYFECDGKTTPYAFTQQSGKGIEPRKKIESKILNELSVNTINEIKESYVSFSLDIIDEPQLPYSILSVAAAK